MWCRIDLTRFVQQLLPPILRSRIMMVLFRVLITPLRYLYNEFLTYRDSVSSRLNITANVQYIQKALNDAFYLTDNQIYIVSPEEERTTTFYFQKEGQVVNYLYQKDGKSFYLRHQGEGLSSDTFIVFIPTYLCSSLDPSSDKYNGKHLLQIYKLLEFYKPAGHSYRIELYDYE